MSPERWRRINEIFALASEEDTPHREHVLDEECGSDLTLREEVERLLRHHDTESNRLDGLQERVASLHRGARTSAIPPDKVLAGRFRVIRFLGAGGMGEVYEALDQELNARVALKKLHDDLAGDAKIMARFKREIQMARRVTNPNVCRVFDLFRHQEGATVIQFLTMELITGETLAARIKRDGPMSTEGALTMLRQLTAGLSAAHAAKVVHRDFKSGNVMIDAAGRVVITDFGMARDIAPEAGRTLSTSSSVAMGTPAYMAPEQIEGKSSTAETDIYALGVVIYEMVTGVLPYADKSPLTVAAKKLKEPPRPPREVRPELPPLWEGVILQCLSRNPKNRFANAALVTQAIESGTRPRRRLLTRMQWIGAAVVGASAGLGLVYYRFAQEQANPETRQRRMKGAESLLTGSYLKAEEHLRLAQSLEPDSAATYIWMAHLYVLMRRTQPAADALATAERLSRKGDSLGPVDRGLLDAVRVLSSGKPREAATILKGAGVAAVAADREAAALLLSLASRYYRLASEQRFASEASKLALTTAPANRFALLESAAAQEVANTGLALRQLQHAQEEFSLDNPQGVAEVKLVRAEVLRRAGRNDEARQEAQSVLDTSELLGDAERRVRALIVRGQMEEASGVARQHGIAWIEIPKVGMPNTQ
ncbi:MAG: serine/threonine protein kinase [Acidobacteria bacterium]|nr:serine/threonine protein kinase [Acidobacteriota bacterium]